MSIGGVVDRLIRGNRDTSPEDVARMVVDTVEQEDLLPIIIEYVQHRRRRMTRHIERDDGVAILQTLRDGQPPIPIPVINGKAMLFDKMRNVQAVLSEPLAIGDGTRMTWGKATLDDLMVRRAMLNRQRTGLDRTIGLLDDAIDVMTQTGVERLEDAFVDTAAG